MEEAANKPQEPKTCCQMRRKVIVAVVGCLPEDQCGVPDSVLADFMRFDLSVPSGKPVISFKFCPWCSKERTYDTEARITDVNFKDPEDDDGEEWKRGG